LILSAFDNRQRAGLVWHNANKFSR